MLVGLCLCVNFEINIGVKADNSLDVVRLFLLKLKPLIGQLSFPHMTSEGIWSVAGTGVDRRKPMCSYSDLFQDHLNPPQIPRGLPGE